MVWLGGHAQLFRVQRQTVMQQLSLLSRCVLETFPEEVVSLSVPVLPIAYDWSAQCVGTCKSELVLLTCV